MPRDTPSYDPLISTSATGVATSGKLNLSLLYFGHRPIIYDQFHHGAPAEMCAWLGFLLPRIYSRVYS